MEWKGMDALLDMMKIGHVKHYQRSTNKSSNVID